ncbi:SIS domain-containing protein [Moorella sp. Hama-1]|uniref:SIS domain-containing protein n=1 Tax=Moorella sp. Hama-1 TaxID=2138101 RepID=UPI000D65BA4F|nr:SIS domain-containing protein [Moorella sp. Hama-1]BCV20654.1 glucosamine--fructose-6-phosphate aminotransferase [Moorella sp. Hama-1]
MSRMLTEIREQPGVLRRLLQEEAENIRSLAARIRERQCRYAVIAARGTSDHAATFAKYALEVYTGLPVALAAPSVITLYQGRLSLQDALVIGISQSGEAADVGEILRQGRESGAVVVTITNEPESTMAREADHLLLCRAGKETALAATKTYTSELALLGLLVAALAGRDDLAGALAGVPDALEACLALAPRIKQAVERYAYMGECVVLGRGLNYPTALEAALKLQETSYVQAQGFSAADFLHGPIAIVDRGFPAIIVAPAGRSYQQMQAMAGQLLARGAELIVLSDQREILGLARTGLELPAVDEFASPLTSIVALQLFACFLAEARGLDPDKPRGLRKVTVTR